MNIPVDNTILTAQATAISNLILTMRQADGFYFDWLVTNQRNYAVSDTSFPRAEIYALVEDSLDQMTGIGSGDYTNAVSWEIHVVNKLMVSSTNPVFDIYSYDNMALDDLKMLFGNPANRSVSGTCDSFLYKGIKREIRAIDQFTPSKFITNWRSVYSQDRANPSEYAGS
jgi:hypothetical protein